MERVMFAITASVFAAIFLVSIIVYGGDQARIAAIGASFLACASQFCGPDPKTYKASIYLAYFSFVVAVLAFILFAGGK